MKDKKTAYPSVRVFENPWLEKLTHVHPLTPLFLWVPIIAWLLWRSHEVQGLSVASIAAVGGVGLFVWTLAEYLLHRFVFHYQPEGRFQERVFYLLHGLHHADPQDPTRLVMPPAPGLLLGGLLFFLFRVLLGEVWVEPFFAFFLVGYLWYDYTHFAVHHFTPRTRYGKMLKQHHMLHHYVDPEARWGVSSPFWDYVFGTLKVKARKKEQAV